LATNLTPRPLAVRWSRPARIVVPADWPASVESIVTASATQPRGTAPEVVQANASTVVVADQSPITGERRIMPTGSIMPQPMATSFTKPTPSRFVEPMPLAYMQPGPAEYRVEDRMEDETKAVVADLTKALMPSVRERAATALAESRYGWKPEIKTHLATAARHDPAPSVRAHCIGLLAKLGYHESLYLAYLEEVAATGSPEVQKAAKAALTKLAPRK